jgi:PAS domain S-box-containing protein
MNTGGIGLWSVDIEVNLLDLDIVALEIIGADHRLKLNLEIVESLIRRDYRIIYDQFKESLINSNKSFEVDLPVITLKDQEKWIRLVAYISESVNGASGKVAGSIQDISEQHLQMQKLEKYWNAISTTSMVTISDENDKIKFVNQKLCNLSGYSRDEIIGCKHNIFSSGHHSPEFFKELWDTISKGKKWEGEILNKHKDGKLIWVHTTIIPIKNDLGKIIEYLSIKEDITNQKIKEEEKDQQERGQAIAEVGGQILHEIMSPVTIMQNHLKLLEKSLETNDFEKMEKSLSKVQDASTRITEIFQDMRDLLTGEQKFEKIVVNEVVESAVNFVKVKLAANKIEFNIDVTCNSCLALGNAGMLQQVIVNLVNNAVDAIKHNDEKWVKISLASENNKIFIKVVDSGKGIPPEILTKIFDSLFTTKKEDGGTGFGLALSRRMVRNMGGDIFVDDKAPNTTFVVKLPISKK